MKATFRAWGEVEFWILLDALRSRDASKDRPYETAAANRMLRRLEALNGHEPERVEPMFDGPKPVTAAKPKRVRLCECGEPKPCERCATLNRQAARRLAR